MYQAKLRSPIAVILLGVITAGIYYWYWFYKVNEEAAIISNDDDAKPGLSLLAASLGALLIIPAFWTHWTTAGRVGNATGFEATTVARVMWVFVLPIVTLGVAGVGYIIWVQGKLNKYGRLQRSQMVAPPAPVSVA